MSTKRIIPTVVPDSFEDVLRARERYAFAGTLHIDAADGAFAPNKTWMPAEEEQLPDAAEFAYGAHLMVEEPRHAGLSFARAGVRRVSAHAESLGGAERANETFEIWKAAGVSEIGVAALLQTPLSAIEQYVPLSDFVLLMSIAEIGRQGAAFDEQTYPRLREFHARHPETALAVDGGVSRENIAALRDAGASIFFIGAALARAEDAQAEYAALLDA